MRKIFPAIAAGAAMLTVAGATFGYAVVRNDVQPFWTTGSAVEQAPPADSVAPDPIVAERDAGRSVSRNAAGGREDLALADSTPKTVTLDNAGKKRKLTTTASTVAGVFLTEKILVDADDEVSPDLAAPLSDGATIRYAKVDTKLVSKRSKVGFETTYKKSAKLDQGQTKVIRKGVSGVRTEVFIEDRRNGELSSRKRFLSKVTTEPRDQIVVQGTKPIKSVLDGGEPAKVGNGGGKRSQIFTTGYTYWDNSPPGSAQIARPQLHERAGGTGTWKDPITVAVQAGRFDFGTRFYLPELKKYFIVEDLCGACHDGRNGGAYTLDIWVDGSHLSSGGAANCASRITRLQPAIEDPKSGLPVATGPVC